MKVNNPGLKKVDDGNDVWLSLNITSVILISQRRYHSPVTQTPYYWIK